MFGSTCLSFTTDVLGQTGTTVPINVTVQLQNGSSNREKHEIREKTENYIRPCEFLIAEPILSRSDFSFSVVRVFRGSDCLFQVQGNLPGTYGQLEIDGDNQAHLLN